VGAYTFGNTPRGGSTAQAIRNTLEAVRVAEEVGLDYFGLGEHQNRAPPSFGTPGLLLGCAESRRASCRLACEQGCDVSDADEAREAWDREAATFDEEADHGLHDPAVRQAWDALMTRLLPDPPARVADLGCGTGTLSILLAKRGYPVTAVDVSPNMLAAAREKARAAGVVVDFQLGDAAQPELARRRFGVVLSRHVIWALPDPGAAFERWVQLLEPGGTVVLIEGRWSTGGGLTAAALRHLVEEHASVVDWEPLNDSSLWGKEISDERYALVVQPHTAGKHPDR
jgi:SAM-dependent methyltransferase